MKKSSLLALIGVGLFLANELYDLIVISFDAWQYGWYQTLSYIWEVAILGAWVLIGQFFFQIYKKSK